MKKLIITTALCFIPVLSASASATASTFYETDQGISVEVVTKGKRTCIQVHSAFANGEDWDMNPTRIREASITFNNQDTEEYRLVTINKNRILAGARWDYQPRVFFADKVTTTQSSRVPSELQNCLKSTKAFVTQTEEFYDFGSPKAMKLKGVLDLRSYGF
jgi:hypothetical protein